MDRFVAMIWNPLVRIHAWRADANVEMLQRCSPRWTVVLDAPGLRVLSLIQRGDAPIATPWEGGDGVIVGPIFERGGEDRGRVAKLGSPDAPRILATGGAYLAANYWGNYVALWRDPDTHNCFVFRDPCGAVPCFTTKADGMQLFFSHPEDVARLSGVHFEIDWAYVQAFILFNYFVTKFTGLKGVTELLAGERLQWDLRGGLSVSWLWNGAAIAANPKRQSFADARDEVRETASACFRAWGSHYRKVVVSLSGGLDSSILVNLLRRTCEAEIVGLHYRGEGYEEYEVKLARLAAAHADIELIEAFQDPAQDDVRRVLKAPKLARPKLQSLAVLIDDLSTNLADSIGADAFMIGQGGDNLFLQQGGARHTLADYVRTHGLGRDFARVAYDAAILQQRSIWQAMGSAMGAALLRRDWRPFEFLDAPAWREHRPLAPEIAGAITHAYRTHPWLDEARRLPRGKADHLLSVIGLYNYYIDHGRGLARDVIYPLFSQPLTELALRTPTYVLGHNGVDRALERGAFADILPDAIARRTGKGGADSYQLQVMQLNIEFYRELILEGSLVKQGWLDRGKIERMLSPDYVVHGGGALFVYLLVAVEAWLHAFDTRPSYTPYRSGLAICSS